MIKIGITGDHGFIGSHLKRRILINLDKYEIIPFKRLFFEDIGELEKWVKECDVIVHLAAKNRHEDQSVIINDNIGLVEKLIKALENVNSCARVIFSSSSQEGQNNIYGNSKKEGRFLLEAWAQKNNTSANCLIIPNVFGPFGKPYYNSFIATFCYQLTHSEIPKVINDSKVDLIYVDDLVSQILDLIDFPRIEPKVFVQPSIQVLVSEVLAKLVIFKDLYFLHGQIPPLFSDFDFKLFNTYRSFIDNELYFPKKFKQNNDARGSFVEVIRLGIGGQVSFSTTVSGVTRGNHFHTRKIERFAVINGEALIQLRKIDDNRVHEFYLSGDAPSYVDMPIWFTHNIKNIGTKDLYTVFWINELYNPEDPDTYFLEV